MRHGRGRSDRKAGREHPIVFFDGTCGLCNGFVDFVLKRDVDAVFKFAPLQGETLRHRQELLAKAGVREALRSVEWESIVLGVDDLAFSKSDAVIRILEELGGKWRLIQVVRVIPKAVRDAAYKWVAQNRYRWFGRRDTCRVPSPEQRGRFLP